MLLGWCRSQIRARPAVLFPITNFEVFSAGGFEVTISILEFFIPAKVICNFTYSLPIKRCRLWIPANEVN